MKVIVAGCSKTGTKSLNAALSELGYKVYDNMDHLLHHCDDWIKIFKGHGSLEDFQRMYKDVDAIVDVPAFLYWFEIHQAFPDAKIILTTRDEDSWFKSIENQVGILNDYYRTCFGIYANKFLPMAWKTITYIQGYIPELTGMPVEVGRLAMQHPLNEMIARRKFRERNAFVLQAAPKDKLLIFNVKDGWKPLCKFLDCSVPSTPFPHKNIKGQDLLNDAKEKYVNIMKKQFAFSLLIFGFFILLFCYFMFDYSYSTQIISGFLSLFALLTIL